MLEALNKLDTAPPLQALLLDTLVVLLYNKPIESIQVDPIVEEVAKAQDKIGWPQILKGWFASTWKKFQDRYLGDRANSRRNGGTWITKVTTTWFEQWLKLWKLRNEDRY
jgi:hypothetical protein